ncbi:hypothetical protein K2173_022579 [Erythroxylum novogranatense]|uniref:Metallothionein n=1 Tax=Erythroxylum novogranatense TaxID=1862640 RepID=A0AAV8TQT7_9ROSI|nr:hypothetical protein K2173_022579 [Erythroxylum novogranatense]
MASTEEGELSSSGDDENPLCSTGDPTVAAKSLAASGSVQVPSVNRTIQSIHAGEGLLQCCDFKLCGCSATKNCETK